MAQSKQTAIRLPSEILAEVMAEEATRGCTRSRVIVEVLAKWAEMRRMMRRKTTASCEPIPPGERM